MKEFKFILSLCIFLIGGVLDNNCNAQQIFDDNSLLIQQYFQTSKSASLASEKAKERAESNRNINVALTQRGDNNEIEIKKKGKNSQSVNQLGNKNYYSFINYYNNTSSNFNVLQLGESNSLQIYGDNSIMKNISIVQKSNFKTLLIKNY